MSVLHTFSSKLLIEIKVISSYGIYYSFAIQEKEKRWIENQIEPDFNSAIVEKLYIETFKINLKKFNAE